MTKIRTTYTVLMTLHQLKMSQHCIQIHDYIYIFLFYVEKKNESMFLHFGFPLQQISR